MAQGDTGLLGKVIKYAGYANPLTAIPTAIADITNLPTKILGPADLIPGVDPFTKRTVSGTSKSTPTSTARTEDTFNPTNGNVGSDGGAAARAAAANRAYALAQLGLVDDQLGRLGTQESVGRSNIASAYDSAFNGLTNSQSQANRDYNTARDTTIQDNVTAKGNIDTGVRNSLTSVQRLLAARGAGSSSAATVKAPYAAAVQGNSQRQQVQTAFGRNIGALDTAHDDSEREFKSAFEELLAERTNKERALEAGIANTRASLLGQKMQLQANNGQAVDPGIINEIRSLGGRIDQLGATQTFNPRKVEYKAPELDKYNYDPNRAPELSGADPGAIDNAGAYYTLLGKDKKAKLAPALA